jgi:hypothetical protein
VEHRDREVGLTVMGALATLGFTYSASQDAVAGRPDPTEALVRDELARATHALRALVALADEAAAEALCTALRDELSLVRERVLAAFSLRQGAEGFRRVTFQLAQRDSQAHALALEWLDVMLTGADRLLVALIEPRLSDTERLSALLRTFTIPAANQHELLFELVHDPDDRWRRPWLSACAMYTAWKISGPAVVESELRDDVSWPTNRGDDESSILHETRAEIRGGGRSR